MATKKDAEFEAIRKTQIGNGCEELELIRGVSPKSLELVKDIYRKRIEITIHDCKKVCLVAGQ